MVDVDGATVSDVAEAPRPDEPEVGEPLCSIEWLLVTRGQVPVRFGPEGSEQPSDELLAEHLKINASFNYQSKQTLKAIEICKDHSFRAKD